MGASTRWAPLLGVVLVGLAWSAPLSHPIPAYDSRLSSLELAIIKCIVETVPGVTKGGGGAFDWSVVQSHSKELEGAEIEVVRVGQREPDFTGRPGDHESGRYPSDWNIVRSVSSQLAARENGHVGGQGYGGEGLSDDWAIVKSISTELHLDVEEVPGDDGIHYAYQAPVRPGGRGDVQDSGSVMFPGENPNHRSGEDDASEGNGKYPIDIRLSAIDPPADHANDIHPSFPRANHADEEFHAALDEYHHHIEDEAAPNQVSGEQNNAGGTIGWSIVRSISSEQEPMSEEIPSHGNEQSTASSEAQEVQGGDDSYSVVQSISTELQPADKEAGEIPASLTEIVPPEVDHTGDSWNSQPLSGAEPSEIHSSETEQSANAEGQEPCEAGHKRIKNVCRRVYTFQLKSHIK